MTCCMIVIKATPDQDNSYHFPQSQRRRWRRRDPFHQFWRTKKRCVLSFNANDAKETHVTNSEEEKNFVFFVSMPLPTFSRDFFSSHVAIHFLYRPPSKSNFRSEWNYVWQLSWLLLSYFLRLTSASGRISFLQNCWTVALSSICSSVKPNSRSSIDLLMLKMKKNMKITINI